MWIHDKGEHATLQVIRWCGSRDLKFLSITGVIHVWVSAILFVTDVHVHGTSVPRLIHDL